MNFRKINIITGHYGSGKTNVSVNMALDLAEKGEKVTVVDLDIVNPYFRTADFKELFGEHNISLTVPTYANSNLDIPALGFDMNGITDREGYIIIDVGGDDEGAKALGRYRPAASMIPFMGVTPLSMGKWMLGQTMISSHYSGQGEKSQRKSTSALTACSPRSPRPAPASPAAGRRYPPAG